MRRLTIGIVCLAACVSAPNGPDAPTQTTTQSTTPQTTALPAVVVEVGNGDLPYRGLSDGEEMVIRHGLAGGWFFELSGRVVNTSPYVSVVYSVTEVSTGEVVVVPTSEHFYEMQAGPDVASLATA